jgi:hypothetical protein
MSDSTDVIDVLNALHRIFRAVDTRDWTVYRSLMADRIEIDYGGISDKQPGWVDADEIAANTRRRLEPLHASQHAVFNHIVEVDGDVATIHFYERALHYHPDLGPDDSASTWILYADCTRKFRRTPEGWLMSAAFVRPIRHEGNQHLISDIAPNVP